MKRQKEYEKKPTTTDANGNLLLIKSYPQDKLLCEFSIPKMNLVEKKDENTIRDNLVNRQTMIIDLNKEEQFKKDIASLINNNQNLKQIIDPINRNIKNNKNYGTSKNGIAQNIVDVGPFVPAGSNFE